MGNLSGTLILVATKNEFFFEAIRIAVLQGGGRLRQARTLSDFKRHLMIYKPDRVCVDPTLRLYDEYIAFAKERGY